MSEASRILVRDDTPANVKLLADLLTVKGYSVVTASSGEEGLKKIVESAPDLVLLDIMMPGMNGYEVCRAIRADPANGILPAVMVTSLDPSQERIKGLEAGAEARAGQTLVSQRIFGRIEDLVHAESAGTLELKGFHRPVPAYNILRLRNGA